MAAEFKIGRLRYIWEGAWVDTKFYNRDAVVSYDGKTYVCLIPHTSSDFYLDLNHVTIEGESTPYWTLMLDGQSWMGVWSPGEYYTLGNIVAYGGSVYKCIENHTSSSTINLNSWEVYIVIESTWSANWSPLTFYKIGDTVKYGGIVYKCVTEHTSAASRLETNIGNWEVVFSGIQYLGDFTSAFSYKLNDVVKFGPNLWICTAYHTSTSDFDETKWNIWIPGLEYNNLWSNITEYTIGDAVLYGGYSYVSKSANNVGNIPPDSLTDWMLLTTGYGELSTWVSNTSYKIGDLVRRGANVYTAAKNTIGDDPSTTTPGEFWNLISPGSRWLNRWDTNVTYIVGDVVAWKNKTYKCVTTHLSDISTSPETDTLEAYWTVNFYHDPQNRLNMPGDIVVNRSTGPEALEIGSDGYLLKTVNSDIEWSSFLETPAVFYVTPTGIDLPNNGTTWDNPWGSIKYACEQIKAGVYNPIAKNTLIQNKEFLVEEAANWQAYQISQGNAPFTQGAVDSVKTRRDARFLVDAIIYDIGRGGNSQTVAFTLSYFDKEYGNKFISTEVADKITYFIATLSHLLDDVATVLLGQTVSPLYQVINGANPVVGQFNSPTVESGVHNKVADLKSIVLTALAQRNTSSVPPENQGATATLQVKTGTYFEELPIVIPANTALNGDELRGVVVRPKVVINTIARRSTAGINKFTVGTTEGMVANTAVQFVSMNSVNGINTVYGNVTQGVTYYVIGSSITSTQFAISLTPGGTEIDLLNYVGDMRVYGGDALSDMFYVEDGTGIRNMTLSGLLGTLTAPNAFTTRRPTGGSFVSLNPGTGVSDTSTWIIRRSPYIQNVTTFGTGAVGMKIDGYLHNGGNKSIVANDFTQIISDGIGIWCTGPDSLTECVSVFAYYGYTGYLAEDGGRIRATNGNSSYGTYGVIAEGYDVNESPITGTVDNRYYQATATPVQSLGQDASIIKLQYSHAGEGYTSSTTNMLNYSNSFTSWTSDGNVTLIQSIVGPTGISDGWLATGNTSGTETSYFYQDVSITPSGAQYTSVAGVNISGSGTSATFDITVNSSGYEVTVHAGGSGYVATNQIRILGSQVGGQDGTNDITITVVTLSGTTITTITSAGSVPEGSQQPYTVSLYAKKGNSPTLDVDFIFSSYLTSIAGISFNFNTAVVSETYVGDTVAITAHTAVPVANQEGWYRISASFYDKSALNNTLQIRVYPRGKTGNAGYSLVYGAQLEIDSTVGFYLATTTGRYTAHANFAVVGAGTGVKIVGDEIRSKSVYQTKVLEVPGPVEGGAGITGGADYVVKSNNAQSGDSSHIVIAASDTGESKTYLGMRLFVLSGTGAGQYGTISYFDTLLKSASILKDSFDQVEITSAVASTHQFALAGTADPYSLYVDQPIQFINTKYVTEITSVSQNSVTVQSTTGGIINQITVDSTSQLTVNMPINFTGTTAGGLSVGYTYYILEIIDDVTLTVSTSLGGAITLLNTASLLDLELNYPSNTGYLVGSTNNMAVNLPIYFTGNTLGNIVAGQTYYINDIYSPTEFTISENLVTIEVTDTTVDSNILTVDDTSALVSLTPIIFTGTNFGGISTNTTYYVGEIVDGTHMRLVQNLSFRNATQTHATSNLITVESTAGYTIGRPIIFTGTTFGGLVNNQVYYISYVNDTTTFTVSATASRLSKNITNTTASTNVITTSSTTTNLVPLNPIVFTGTGFGGITSGVEYFINAIVDSSTFTVSSSIIATEATETADTSNLITVTDTSGFIANTPIIFGGTSLGGIVSGRVYYISAINDSTTFTISESIGGAAVSLTTAVGSMAARTLSQAITLSTASGTMVSYSTYCGAATTLTTAVGNVIAKSGTTEITLTTGTGSFVGTSTTAKSNITAASGSMPGTFSVPLIGGVVLGTTYYVTSVSISATPTFTISESIAGPDFVPTEATGSMSMGEVGWDHVTPGTPPVVNFDASTVYSIEPRVVYSNPSFTVDTATLETQPPGTSYCGIAYGENLFAAIPNNYNSVIFTDTLDIWSISTLPYTATWSSIAYGNGYWVIISSGGSAISGSRVLYSNSSLRTWKTAYLPSISTWNKVVYGNGKFVAIASGTNKAAYSTNAGASWTACTGLASATWTGLAYGASRFVAVSSGSTASYSTDGITWTSSSMPTPTTWSSIVFGAGRFVAISSASGKAAYSFDGITWSQSLYDVFGTSLSYGDGVFVAVTDQDSTVYTSEDGQTWKRETGTSSLVGDMGFGYIAETGEGKFVTVGGTSSSLQITAGCKTKARPEVSAGKIIQLNEWEPGSGYASAPTVTLVDTNATKIASLLAKLGNGVLSSPTFVSGGTGYNTSSTTIEISGNGYADNSQTGISIIINNLTKLPHAGDNLAFAGNDTVYKVTDAVLLNGTVAPNILARVDVSPEISVGLSPAHGTDVTVRTKYSQVRLTNHDFLNIGYGNIEESNYPGFPVGTELSTQNECVETNYGRVFYSSTDQDGNFRVGKLFAVEQATGIVTLSASQFGLSGLDQLTIGGIAVGGTSVIIRQFSTDSTFVANSNEIVPTQKAIKAHLASRLSQGGSNTFTGVLIAGTVLIGGPNRISSTVPAGNPGSVVNMPVKVNVAGIDGGGWDGQGMTMSMFMRSFSRPPAE